MNHELVFHTILFHIYLMIERERENIIKELGYNLVVMWESDWNKINL